MVFMFRFQEIKLTNFSMTAIMRLPSFVQSRTLTILMTLLNLSILSLTCL